jgi:hypothetical protein
MLMPFWGDGPPPLSEQRESKQYANADAGKMGDGRSEDELSRVRGAALQDAGGDARPAGDTPGELFVEYG